MDKYFEAVKRSCKIDAIMAIIDIITGVKNKVGSSKTIDMIADGIEKYLDEITREK
jgi:hypothetical protein